MVSKEELFEMVETAIGKELLKEVKEYDDLANGVQIDGSEKIDKVALGVSASVAFFEKAIKAKAQACIFHHGLVLTDKSICHSRLDLGTQKRLKLALTNNLTVAGYHAALDRQPEFGNNATIINKLGGKRLNLPYFDNWGWVAEFDKAQPTKKLAEKLSRILNHKVMAIYGGKKMVKRIGVVSGGAKPYAKELMEIKEKKVELHISGEIGEPGPATARDMGFNYFSGGHYATEVFGIQELGKKIKAYFKDKVETEFIDVPNRL